MNQRIYLSPPDVGEQEREALLRAFDSGWIAPVGPEITSFEQEMASYLGVSSAVALSSGTAALHMALVAHGVGVDDVVLVQSFTFAATANAVRYVGAQPWFIGSEAQSWNMCPNALEDALKKLEAQSKRPAAMIVVDLYGCCADYDSLNELSIRYGVPIIEDAAESLGSHYQNRKAGGLGYTAALSFNGNKIITTSGGGMLVCDDEDRAQKVRYLSTQAREPVLHYEHTEVGYNYRMSNLLAALGRAQLSQLDSKVEKKQKIRRRYRQALGDDVSWNTASEQDADNAWLSTCVLRSGSLTPAEVCARMNESQIECRPLWKPMHLQPVYQQQPYFGSNLSNDLYALGLCLPSGASLSEESQDRVIQRLREVLGRASPS